MEFLRFGSSIPGSYWGCCAADVIQNFKVDPDAKASIQLVNGDSGTPLSHVKGGHMYAGPTYKDIFEQRLRYGTFSNRDMPNHAFFVMLAEGQINSEIGKKWLAILKANGFEFLRKVNNSVWNVNNYIFVLIRNVGDNSVDDQFTPPKVWSDLPSVVPEPCLLVDGPGLTKEIEAAQKPLYDALPKGKFLTEKEVVDAGAPVILAGLRSANPQELKGTRDARRAAEAKKNGAASTTPSLKGAPASPAGFA